MISRLRYGASASFQLPLEDDSLVAYCEAPRGEPIDDVAAAVDRALECPLDFPPLAQAVVPGDKVVLALAEPVPHEAEIIERTLDALASGGVAAQDITLLRGRADEHPERSHRGLATLVTKIHDPANRDSLSYLAASTDGKPIYLNRAIHEADLVISIGSLRLADSLGYHGINSDVFPAFSDTASIERYRSSGARSAAQRARLRKDADEVGWLLGARFTIQVVPGAGGAALHVLAGDHQCVAREGSLRCQEAWGYQVPRRADLVVATIEGSAGNQTWENIGRALSAAGQALEPEGSVAICCELDQPPDAALRQMLSADNLDDAGRLIARHKPADAAAGIELVRALKRGKVYLVSQLDDELVEDLGMLPAAPDDISRLARRHASCIVLTNAQYAIAHPRVEQPLEAPSGRSRRRK